MREVEVCGRGGEVEVCERWRCVREVERCGGRVGGVWERWRCVREVECGGVCGRGGGV